MKESKSVKELVAGIRRDLTQTTQRFEEIQEEVQDFSLARNKTEMEAGLEEVIAHSVTMPHEAVPSPRPVLGWAITTFKKVILWMSRPFVAMVLSEQIEFNESVAEQLKLTHESLRQLTKDVDTLQREFEVTRLKQIQTDDLSIPR